MFLVRLKHELLNLIKKMLVEFTIIFIIKQEKEMIFLVVKKEAKNPIMRAVMEEAGLNSKAKSIVFSLPVTETAGMRLIEDTI